MPDYPEPDKPREEALEAAVRDLGEASSVEEVAAAPKQYAKCRSTWIRC